MNLFTNSVWVLIEKDNQWVPYHLLEKTPLIGLNPYYNHGQPAMFDTEQEAQEWCNILNKGNKDG